MLHETPMIGVTGPDGGGEAAWWFARLGVWLAGGHAVRIRPGRPRGITGLNGLVIGGGADVDPDLYGGTELAEMTKLEAPTGRHWPGPVASLLYPITLAARRIAAHIRTPGAGVDPSRDRLELSLIEQAVERGLPILGICRGAQLLNVYFGGSLHQDVSGFYVEDPATRSLLPRKRIELVAESLLAGLMGPEPTRVNALHRQAIDQTGNDLRVAARDLNGIIQAVEHTRRAFIVGVQWHPEYLPHLDEQRAIFNGLVRAASGAPVEGSIARPICQTAKKRG